MKIIDFEKRGNLVRFYLGADDCDDYYGDDWNDRPYEHNAGPVYEEFVQDYIDVAFHFDWIVMEPKEDWRNQGNSEWCKDDMRDRKVPCIVAVPPEVYHSDGGVYYTDDTFGTWVGNDKAVRIYFNDSEFSLMKYDCIIVRSPKDYVRNIMEAAAARECETDNG